MPAEEVENLHQFSWVIGYYISPDDLLRGEDEGRYEGVRKNWDVILNAATRGAQRDYQGEEIKREKDEAEGILYERPATDRSCR